MLQSLSLGPLLLALFQELALLQLVFVLLLQVLLPERLVQLGVWLRLFCALL